MTTFNLLLFYDVEIKKLKIYTLLLLYCNCKNKLHSTSYLKWICFIIFEIMIQIYKKYYKGPTTTNTK